VNAILERIVRETDEEGLNMIHILQKVQDAFGYVSEQNIDWLSARLDVPASRFFGVITFYPKFRTRPAGTNTLTVCSGAACHIKGGEGILGAARTALGLSDGEDTSADRLFTLETATCVGACNIAPIVILNDRVIGDVNPGKITGLIERIREDNRPGV